MPRRLYFDANIFIELIEHNSSVSDKLARLYGQRQALSHEILTSELTLAEVLVHPLEQALRSGDQSLRERYVRAVSGEIGISRSYPVTSQILQRAAHLHAHLKVTAALRLKLPDATHLATALETSCEIFLSNDDRLCRAVDWMVHHPDRDAGNSQPAIARVVSFSSESLDALATELQCP